MVEGFEILLTGNESETARRMLGAIAALGRRDIRLTNRYYGEHRVLIVWGVGEKTRNHFRTAHIAKGGRVLCFDLGYFQRAKVSGACRVSIDHDHPWRLLDSTPDDASRWEALGIPLRNDHRPDGHVVVVGLGDKTKRYLKIPDWDEKAVDAAKKRYPGVRVVYRPKPHKKAHRVHKIAGVFNDVGTPIENCLRDARIVICRHSNVALDATVAGVPFESDDGVAHWLRSKPFTVENRKALLHRAAWWQWKHTEAKHMMSFLEKQI